MFGVLQVLTVKWATGDLPEECQFFLNTQLMFFCKNEKEPATLLFDDNELIRSLTEAETITAVIPSGSPKSATHPDGKNSFQKKCQDSSLLSVKEKSKPSGQQ